jgi:hypothetical protein
LTKSYEFRQRLADKRVTYLEGRCLSYGNSVPYHPIIDPVRNNCGITETDSPEAMVEKGHFSLQEAGMDIQEAAPDLLRLLGVQEGTEAIAACTPEAIKAADLWHPAAVECAGESAASSYL